MTSEGRHDEDIRAPEESVLGSLPRERPGRRSPRRQASRSEPADAGSPGPRARTGGDAEAAAESGRGVEDLAWAGIAIAAEAATLGVRLANRVLEAGGAGQRRAS